MAVKIVIEPIFEADFPDNSYGFRPKRSAHQAVEDVTYHLFQGKTDVIDADISKYFDTIPHDKLMQLVAKRIVDKQILRLIRKWLKAPIVEEREDGKKEYKGNEKGTPQGGVISPLLANIYLNVLDTLWVVKEIQERLGARLVRYADDCVILCRGNTDRILKGVKRVFGDLGLTLNEEKTRVFDARQEMFQFLGFSIGIKRGLETGKRYTHTEPSKKALKHIRSEIKQLTTERYSAAPTEDVIRRVNEIARGWVGYFRFGNCTQAMSAVRRYMLYRMRIYLRRKHHYHSFGYKAFPDRYYYDSLGLYEVPTKAPWVQNVKATG
jgi:group II intron reverse transcriptase/maturase